MHKLAPLPKIILVVCGSTLAMLLNTPLALGILTAFELALFMLARVWKANCKALAGLSFFALLLALMQYAMGGTVAFSATVALRMVAMSALFMLLLATTRMQDLTAMLVRQLGVPYEYAFMLTSALRFVPDFLAEIKAVQEAQACRGYSCRGGLKKRLTGYLTVVQPLVLRAVDRAETMAMSMELRGFGRGAAGSYGSSIGLKLQDYMVMGAALAVTATAAATKLLYII